MLGGGYNIEEKERCDDCDSRYWVCGIVCSSASGTAPQGICGGYHSRKGEYD